MPFYLFAEKEVMFTFLGRYCKHFLGRTTRWVCMPMVFVFAVLTADEQEPRVDLVRMCLSTAQRRLSCLFEDLFLRFEPEFLQAL